MPNTNNWDEKKRENIISPPITPVLGVQQYLRRYNVTTIPFKNARYSTTPHHTTPHHTTPHHTTPHPLGRISDFEAGFLDNGDRVNAE